jgi:hypothetical protein
MDPRRLLATGLVIALVTGLLAGAAQAATGSARAAARAARAKHKPTKRRPKRKRPLSRVWFRAELQGSADLNYVDRDGNYQVGELEVSEDSLAFIEQRIASGFATFDINLSGEAAVKYETYTEGNGCVFTSSISGDALMGGGFVQAAPGTGGAVVPDIGYTLSEDDDVTRSTMYYGSCLNPPPDTTEPHADVPMDISLINETTPIHAPFNQAFSHTWQYTTPPAPPDPYGEMHIYNYKLTVTLIPCPNRLAPATCEKFPAPPLAPIPPLQVP